MAAKEVKDESIPTQMVEDDSKQHVSTELDSCGVVIERPLPLLLQLQQARDHSPNCVIIGVMPFHLIPFCLTKWTFLPFSLIVSNSVKGLR